MKVMFPKPLYQRNFKSLFTNNAIIRNSEAIYPNQGAICCIIFYRVFPGYTFKASSKQSIALLIESTFNTYASLTSCFPKPGVA